MLTLDKLKLYQRFDGDADGWARMRMDDDTGMTDDDWLLIDELRHGFALIAADRASPAFAAALEQRLRDVTPDEATRQVLRKL